MFVEKYGTAKKPTGQSPSGKNYDEYDIVMQIYFRDTIIAVQKWVEFPKILEDGKEVEALTAIQKQQIIDGLIAADGTGGYHSTFELECNDLECTSEYDPETIYITKNDPAGWYTGFIPIGDNPEGTHNFSIIEHSVSELTGLELDEVSFTYYRYVDGKQNVQKIKTYSTASEESVVIKEGTTKENLVPVSTVDDKTLNELFADGQSGENEGVLIDDITLDKENKIAEIQVMNTYREKEVKINYVAVGNGTVDIEDGVKNPLPKDSENFLFYSGKPQGVVATPDANYTFAGWYLDEKCTVSVDENHGYVDIEDGIVRFTPNKNKTVSDDTLEVTYYAKFSIGSLQIIRENAEPGQVFVYEIKDKNEKVVMYATVVVGEDGKGSTEIVNASFGTDQSVGLDYTVTQLNDWSWRYDDIPITQTHKVTKGLHGSMDMTTEFVFNGDSTKENWLNGNSTVEVNKYLSAGGTD